MCWQLAQKFTGIHSFLIVAFVGPASLAEVFRSTRRESVEISLDIREDVVFHQAQQTSVLDRGQALNGLLVAFPRST